MSSRPQFHGQRILVTGASGAIGQATALAVVSAGAHVVLTGRDLARLEVAAAQLPEGRFTLSIQDLSDADALPNWMRGLAEKDGPFSGVAHIAGIQSNRPLRMMDMSFIHSMLHTNTTTAIMLGKALRQRVCHTDGAGMVLVGSVAARMYGAGNIAYAASKGAIAGATKALAHELLRDNIRVNCVIPSLIASPMAERASKTVSSESWKALEDKHLLGVGSSTDVAEAITYLLSSQARWMTGSELLLDGGFSLH